MGRPKEPLAERFFAKVGSRDPRTGCSPWLGTRIKDGYGQIGSGRKRPKQWLAHRVAYALYHGVPVPPSRVFVLHKCDNPRCVEPRHLFLGTQTDNVRDCVAKGRQWNARKTHCPAGHEYNVKNTSVRRTSRKCRICDKLRHRKDRKS